MKHYEAISLAACLVIAPILVATAGSSRDAAAAVSPAKQPATTDPPSDDPRVVFLSDCAVCHGPTGEGSTRGPSLVGVGAASADYMLTTGRMPLASPDAHPQRSKVRYSPQLVSGLTRIVAEFGDGPPIPDVDIRNADVAAGGEAYRLNCAACHQAVGSGGALINREAPTLVHSTPRQVVEALRIGPGQMPSFGTAALDENQARDVAAYVQTLRNPDDRGGLSIWHLGPVPEGGVALVVGLGLAALITMWIGSREPKEQP